MTSMGCRRSVSGGGAWLSDGGKRKRKRDELQEKLVSLADLLVIARQTDCTVPGLNFARVTCRYSEGQRRIASVQLERGTEEAV